MEILVLGLIIFFGSHLVPVFTALRESLVKPLGRSGFMIAFSIASIVGLVLIVKGYQSAQAVNFEIWSPPVWTAHISVLLMLFAMIALAAAYIPSHLRTMLKHPMLVAIKIWALAHLIANGDFVSMLIFGSFLAYAVIDRISVKRRGALGPLGTVQGGMSGDIAAIVVGAGAYALFLFYAHLHLFGVAPIPRLSW